MAGKRFFSPGRTRRLLSTLAAILVAMLVVVAVVCMASTILHLLGMSRSMEDISIIDNSTEKITVVTDQTIDTTKDPEPETEEPEPSEEPASEASETAAAESETTETESTAEGGEDNAAEAVEFELKETSSTAKLSDSKIGSKSVLLIDAESGDILVQKNADEELVPTAMTKLMTALTAAEALGSDRLDETVTMTADAIDYCKEHKQSTTGLSAGDQVTVRDLFYGTVISAGGDAAYQLAVYTAGSMDAFVDLMNSKVAQLGLAETTNFMDPIGCYNENHYSTAKDFAIIMREALNNEVLEEFLSTKTYKVNDVSFKNKFFERLKTRKTAGTVIAAKAGYIKQSGGCCVSYYEGESGKRYICVTAGAKDNDYCANDQVAILNKYAK